VCLKDFYSSDVKRANSFNKDGTLRNANEAWANEKDIIDAIKDGKIDINGEQVNQAIRDFIPDTVNSVVDGVKDTGNYIDAIAPTTNAKRLDELYGSPTDGSLLQANMATSGFISTATMFTGVGSVAKSGVKAGIKGINNKIDKSIDDALDIKVNPLDDSIKGVETNGAFWSDRKNRTSVENAYRHYVKHKNEFPGINNAVEYVKATKSFTRNPPNGTLIKSDADGFRYYYNEQINTFAVVKPDGTPMTMYKPTSGKKEFDDIK